MAIKITYKKGYPTKKCLREIFVEYNIHGLSNLDSYGYTHALVFSQWGAGNQINEEMLNFVDTLNELGIKVSKFREAKSPTTGLIELKKVE